MSETTASTLTLARGGLYLSHQLCDRYFAGLETVILLWREDELWVLPVRHAAAGGYLLKRRNSAGDRFILAPDFLRERGLDDLAERQVPVRWDSDHAALVAKCSIMQT